MSLPKIWGGSSFFTFTRIYGCSPIRLPKLYRKRRQVY